MNQTQISSLPEHHARLSRLLDSEKEQMTQEENSPSSLSEFWKQSGLSGLSGKTSPEFFQSMTDEPSTNSFRRLLKSGTAFRGECLTLNTSEFPKDAVESLLSDILETGDHLKKFFLSPKACLGILRRAEKREKELPLILKEALERQGGGLTVSGKETFPTLTASQGSKQWLGNQEAFSGDYFISQKVSRNDLNNGRVVVTLGASGAGLNIAAGNCNELDFCIIDKAVSENQKAEVLLSDKLRALSIGGGKPGQGYPCVLRYSKSHRDSGKVDLRVIEDGTTNTLSTGPGCTNQSTQNIVCYRTNGISQVQEQGDKAACLNTMTDKSAQILREKSGVRRLTPLECERLQGFPDNYTNILYKYKNKNKNTPDSLRYKAMGNSMAVPVIGWLGQQIMKIEENQK